MKFIIVLWILLAVSFSIQASEETEIGQLEKQLAHIQQESQSTYQQFLMIQELRRNEISEAPLMATPIASPDRSVPIPKYEELVQQRQEKQEKIRKYALELDQLYNRYKALEHDKQSILEQINSLQQKTEE